MTDISVSNHILLVNEQYEPLTNVDVVLYDQALGTILAVVQTDKQGVAFFDAVMVDSIINYWYKPRVSRNTATGRVYLYVTDPPALAGTQLVFLTEPLLMTPTVQSDPMTVERQDSTGVPVTVGTQSVYLYSTDAMGTFDAINPRTIADGDSQLTFKFTPSVGGDPVITASMVALT